MNKTHECPDFAGIHQDIHIGESSGEEVLSVSIQMVNNTMDRYLAMLDACLYDNLPKLAVRETTM